MQKDCSKTSNIQANLIITTPKRVLWSEDDLVAAVRAVQCGRLSTYKAAERHKIPRRTIRNHLQTAKFYDIVEKVIKELGLENKPERIYNIDETSYCSDPQKTKVVGLKGFPSTRTTSSAGKTNTTVLIASNAAGGKGPPIIIFKGKHVWSGWTSDEAYPGTLYTATSNGWIESEAFAEFMAKSFIPMVKHETEPALLIYDGHSTHVQLAVIEMAKQNNITIIKLPPHTSHLLQPLDLSVFKPYKDAWDQEMVKWQRTHKGEKLPKDQFSATVGRVWKNLNSNVIKKGFEKSGIYPFNRNAVPEHKLDPEALKRWKKHHENLSEEQTLACSSPITLAKLCLNKINACMTCIKLSIPVTILPNDKISSKNIFSEHFELPISSKSSEKISFEDLLIQSTKKSQTGNVKQKKVKISASAEVITHEDVIERLRQKENDKAKKEEEKEEKRKQREQKQKDRLNKQNEKNDKVKNFDEKSKTNMRMTKNKQSQVADPPSSETALSELIPFNSDLNFRDPIHHLQDDSSIPNCLASSSESPLPIPSKPKIAILEDRYLKVDEKLTKEVFTGHKMKRPADFTLQGTEEKNINKKIEQEGRNNPKKIQTRKREKKQKKTKIEEDLEDDSDFTFMIQMILRRLVFKFCESNDIKHPFNQQAKVAGKDWFKKFMKRHPEISRRKAQFMNPARAQKLNKFIVDDHFQRLNEIYDKLDLKSRPEKIYNMDEKGCRLTIHHQQTVLAQKGAKRVHLQSSEHAESVTIAGCVNALGTSIPPMIIFKGKRLKPELYDNLPPGTLVEKSAKGYMTNELFIEFLKHLARYKTPGKCLLIRDENSQESFHL
ncbi:hypothetical protein SFRURICE_009678 [Spodoptera frugiperda]|nr:hypothetical protein SFRURICE_009678 [Spodoptera frugiperda]